MINKPLFKNQDDYRDFCTRNSTEVIEPKDDCSINDITALVKLEHVGTI